jgi:hypothetical protein
MPVAVATGRCLQGIRLDAGLDPPISDRHVVMGGVRLTDPLEQHLLDQSAIGFATIPRRDEGGLSLQAVNRMIAGAVKGLKQREGLPH